MKKLTLKKKFDIFCESVGEYETFFGLNDWDISVTLKEANDECGGATYDTQSRWAAIYANKSYLEQENNTSKIEQTAFHECAEIFMGDIYDMIARNHGVESAEKEVHKVVRFMENKIFRCEK